ncbi:MAG: type II 3-dehydroquinate dehydratase [Clostridia bacterium]|nr:type II 3-dehydroquinate dehydratase [Clostridia bacterium]
MKILIINGPNLNLLGIREPEIYGNGSYKDLVAYCKDAAKKCNIRVSFFQSNCEGRIVTKIQRALKKYDAIVINPAAYTHTSVAILDALKSVGIPTVEVHLSDLSNREDFRKTSYVSLYAQKTISGKGFEGYKEAIEYLYKKITGC